MRPSLISQRLRKSKHAGVLRYHHPALSGRDLLVWVKCEHSCVRQWAHLRATRTLSTIDAASAGEFRILRARSQPSCRSVINNLRPVVSKDSVHQRPIRNIAEHGLMGRASREAAQITVDFIEILFGALKKDDQPGAKCG
jgi:hypothetical protein